MKFNIETWVIWASAQHRLLRNKRDLRLGKGESEFGGLTAEVGDLTLAEAFILLLGGGVRIGDFVL